MSEIHKGNNEYVYLDLYGQGADAVPTVTCTDSDGVTTELTVFSAAPEDRPADAVARYYVILGLGQTQKETQLKVHWDFSIGGTPVSRDDYFDVVTPYLSTGEVKAIYPEATDEEARRLEASVRFIIEAYTGQKFGHSVKTLTVEGHGESALRLPERLLKITRLETLTTGLNPLGTLIVSDGWYLKKGWTDVVSDIPNDSTYWSGFDPDDEALPGEPGYEKQGHGHIIHAPGTAGRPTEWRNDYPFKITGEWGYYTVPQDVKEAARLLVNDYACSEAAYRDRYLKTVEASDWKLEFFGTASMTTGNARADQLLSKYVILDWAVV